MNLADFIRDCYVPTRLDLCEQYEAKLFRVARQFSAFLARPATLADLTERNVCGHLSAYRKQWSARSTNNARQVLLSLWLEAADRPEASLLVEQPRPKRIRKSAEEIDPPRCWRKKQIRQLIRYVQTLPGMVGDVPAADWWLSLLLSIHWTSSRIGAMLAVQSSDYDGRGLLVHRQKNKRPQWFPLPRSCRRIIDRTRPDGRGLLWSSPWCPRHIWTRMRQIIEAAGLPCPRTGRNLFHRLRRTTITYCAKADPAIAQRTAGHRDYATTLRSYVDPSIVRLPSAADVLFDPLAASHPTIPNLRIYG